MQSAVIEFSRNVLGLKDANSTEMNPKTSAPVISLINEQKNITEKGGTMRLGAYDCYLNNESNAFRAYKKNNISERHRHRYEFNNYYRDDLEKAGLNIAGINNQKKQLLLLRIIT